MAAVPPNFTVMPAVKLVPVRVIVVPTRPEEGATRVIAGAADAGAAGGGADVLPAVGPSTQARVNPKPIGTIKSNMRDFRNRGMVRLRVLISLIAWSLGSLKYVGVAEGSSR